MRRPLAAAIPGGVTALLLVLALATGGAAASSPGLSSRGAAAAASPLRLSARSAALIEQSTGKRLYGLYPNRELPIASATKLMTALLTLEHERRLSRVFTQTGYYPAAADSQIGLVPGERMSVHDLLLALMLPSADDAAEDLAYNVGHRSVGRFIAMMNARARQLGLRHTHYSTPIGLDSPGNYSSAADLVRLASYDLVHSAYFARIVALPYATLRSGNHIRHVVNRNDLVGRIPWIDGVKTGHTAGAGYVLIASAHRDGMTLLSAVLGTSSEGSRDANTMALLDYGFAGFRLAKPVRAGQVLARPTVAYRPGVHAALIAATAFTRALPRQTRLRVRVRAPRQLTGPLRRHAEVGSAVVLADGRPIARIPLLLARALPAVGTLTIAARFLTGPLMLPVIAAVCLAALALAILAGRRKRTRMGRARRGDGGGGLEAA